MLAKTLGLRILFCLPVLFITSCSAGASPPMIGQRLSTSLLESNFCKKYKCEISDQLESVDTVLIDIVMPGNKYSGKLDPLEAMSSLELKFSKNTDLLVSASVFFGTDYAINRLKPEYAELANDFYKLMTGKKIMYEYEYSNGGAITTCLSSLGKQQRSGKPMTHRIFIDSVLLPKGSYIASCFQLGNREVRQVNRWMTIQVK